MKKKTILIVPPRGTPVRAFRIRLSVAILLCIISLGGLAGYFIPFNSFTLDQVEQNQKKNLSEQNRKLLQRIVSTLRLLNSLKDQVRRLEAKQESILEVTGPQHVVRERRKRVDFTRMSPEAILVFVEQRQKRLETLAAASKPGSSAFDRIPVVKPVLEHHVISNVFGICKDPFTSKEKFHYGLDFVAEVETPVVATADGTVARVENNPVWGRRIVIDHGGGFMSVYAHLGPTRVLQGRRVRKGEPISSIGLSGLTTGPHLHYELWRDGKAVNPEDYFYPLELAQGSSTGGNPQ